MTKEEIALQLTITALQANKISLWYSTLAEASNSKMSQESYEEVVNTINAKKIVEFYKNVLQELD